MNYLPKVDQVDWGYVNVDPDPDFDADHNKRVIAKTIRENEKMYKRKKRAFKEKSQERTSAVASYLKSVAKDRSNTTTEQYFGKRYLTELRGKQIVDIMKNAEKKQKSKKA